MMIFPGTPEDTVLSLMNLLTDPKKHTERLEQLNVAAKNAEIKTDILKAENVKQTALKDEINNNLLVRQTELDLRVKSFNEAVDTLSKSIKNHEQEKTQHANEMADFQKGSNSIVSSLNEREKLLQQRESVVFENIQRTKSEAETSSKLHAELENKLRQFKQIAGN
jgi:soluble cytochrome b562